MAIKSRKNKTILNIEIDGEKYWAWFWNPYSIHKELLKKLIEKKSWLICIETDTKNINLEIPNCLKISPYYLGENYLSNNKKARDILINNVLKYVKNENN
ncbi:hypothetical protein [Polaribacter sp.]|uniref:hypothetical protein n=1 Tax=Polaribacter sp. TaxID=1920175 RepID=UPI003F6B4882